MVRADPAAWLAGQDIAAYIDATFSDPLALGREALALAGGDLLIACQQREELRAEVVLAWLEKEAPGAREAVRLAAAALAEAEAGAP